MKFSGSVPLRPKQGSVLPAATVFHLFLPRSRINTFPPPLRLPIHHQPASKPQDPSLLIPANTWCSLPFMIALSWRALAVQGHRPRSIGNGVLELTILENGMRSEGFGLRSMWIRNSTQHKVGLQLGLCTEMKPSDLIRCPDFSECYLFNSCSPENIMFSVSEYPYFSIVSS